MAAPTNTYNSTTNLSLGAVPQLEDPELYRALLDVHNAIEILLTNSDDTNAIFLAYITKQRKVNLVTGTYLIADTDGTILLNASTVQTIAYLPSAATYVGFSYRVKCVNDKYGAFLSPSGAELLETENAPFELFEGEYVTVRSDGTNWIVG